MSESTVGVPKFQYTDHHSEPTRNRTGDPGSDRQPSTRPSVLGHNYPSSSWYKEAFELLQKQGLSPQINAGSQLASLKRG